jgi:PAS domain S-box-containing protein
MLEFFTNLLSSKYYIPHGHCYLWQTPLVWLHLLSDALIAIAYFSIPAMLIYFVRKRKDIPFPRVFWLFGAFIVLCGTGHLLEIWTLWHPDYWVSGVENALTALVSCYTALQLVELLPQFLALQTPEHLEVINRELEKQVAERQRTEAILRMIVAGTASVTGNDFFPALVQNLATALAVQQVMICEIDRSRHTARTLAFWLDGQLVENIEYPLSGTPCEVTLVGKTICTYSEQIQQRFPDAPLLKAFGAESYVGVPLLNAEQEAIGYLCILDAKPLVIDDRTKAMCSVFAARAATELQRKWAEDERHSAYEELEFRVAARTAELSTANLSLTTEIRERIVAQTALQQSQEQFSKAFHSNPIACCIVTLKAGRFLDVNSSFLNLFGYSREELMGKTARELQIWANPADRRRLLRDLRHHHSVQLDAPFYIRCGEVRAGMFSFEQIELQGETCLLSMIYDVTARKQAEAEQHQQMRLAALRADIGTALTEGESLHDMLNRCAIALHEHLDAAFARIWMLNEPEQVLILQASAGMYTHLNGKHSRIGVGQFKIGWIAQHRQPHLTNQVTTDPRVSDQAWARREGMVSFAGYPLMIQNRLLGVVAIFARHPLPERTIGELSSAASAIAVGIDRKLAEAALRQTADRERAVTRVLRRMRETLDLETIFHATTQELRQAISCDRTLIYRFRSDWSGKVLAESVAEGWNAVVPLQTEAPELIQAAVNQPNCIIKRLDGSEILIKDTYLQEQEGGLYRHQLTCRWVSDIYQAGFSPCYLKLLESLQARAYIIAPILCGSHLWGLLATYQNSGPREWQLAEIQMVTQISNQLGVAVQQAELLAQTQEQAEQLREAKEAADAANRAKSEFLANMSHELRTPLNVILGLTQLMDRDPALSPEHRHYLETIGSSGEHLLGLINEVLEMSKIEAGRLMLHESCCDLHRLLDSLGNMLEFKAVSKGLQFSVEYSPSLPQQIITDEGKLRQILINLLVNAIKFTTTGRVTVRARLLNPEIAGDLELAGQCSALPSPPAIAVCFEVEDTGPGIDPNELKQLFKPFEQTQSGIAVSEGTGLGLAISQKYAQMMGGGIVVSSQPGQGSVFAFWIAAELAESVKAAPSLIAGKVLGLAPGQPKYRILIAEDNPTNRLLLHKILQRIGFDLKEATNGQEAIDTWKAWQPDLIFMDMRMPILDGQDAVQQIRTAEALFAPHDRRRTIIVALTASAFSEHREEMLTAGCDDFICKPFKVQEILETIARHLDAEYLYETPIEMPQADSSQTGKHALAPETLKLMPSTWLERLHAAALQADDLQILELTSEVPASYPNLVKALQNLSQNFQFATILDALTKCLS